jgi:probable phosphoglycerate mutase
MRLYFIRHGETQTDEHGLYDDSSSLTELGRSQAERVAAALADKGITSVVTSPAARAIETARPLLAVAGITASVSDEFKEIDIGPLVTDGVPYRAIMEDDCFIMDCTHNGGESFELFRDRVLRGVNGLINGSSDHDATAVFTHAGVKSVAIDHCYGKEVSRAMRTFYANASISTVEVTGSGFRVADVDDIAHLI